MMKKKVSQLFLLLLFVGLLFAGSLTTQAASEKSDGKNMKKVLDNYKKKNYSNAQKYANKLNKTAKEACVNKMSKDMKKAYKKGKAVKVATLAGGHVSYYAYPKHKGIVIQSAHMGYESISVVTIKNGKVTTQSIGSRDLNNKKNQDYLSLGCWLDNHIKYESYKRSVDLSPFK